MDGGDPVSEEGVGQKEVRRKKRRGNDYFVGQSPTSCSVFCLLGVFITVWFGSFSKGVSLALGGVGQGFLPQIHLPLPLKC